MIPTIKYAKHHIGVDYITSLDDAIQALKNSMVEYGACHGIFEPGDATRYKYCMLQIMDGIVLTSLMGIPHCIMLHHSAVATPSMWPEMNEHTKRFMCDIFNRVFHSNSDYHYFDHELGRAIFQEITDDN